MLLKSAQREFLSSMRNFDFPRDIESRKIDKFVGQIATLVVIFCNSSLSSFTLSFCEAFLFQHFFFFFNTDV